MELFKFLIRKQVHSFEKLLQKAAKEPVYREEFINRILTEKLFIITKDSAVPDGNTTPENGLMINSWILPDGRMPVFTSADRIFDKRIKKEQVNYLELTGRDIFKLASGATVVLNPYSGYGKEFAPEEIKRLLNGTYYENSTKQIVFKKDTQVQIGQPVKYPAEMVSSLIKLFSGKPDVLATYLGWIFDPASDDPPHYIFAIDTKGDWKTINKEAGLIAQQFLGPDEIIDFIQINGKGGFEEYFVSQTKPFYKANL